VLILQRAAWFVNELDQTDSSLVGKIPLTDAVDELAEVFVPGA
jgi:hypothetical protein